MPTFCSPTYEFGRNIVVRAVGGGDAGFSVGVVIPESHPSTLNRVDYGKLYMRENFDELQASSQ